MAKKPEFYVLLAALDEKALRDSGADYEQKFDTQKEAKERVKYILSKDFQASGEMSYQLTYAELQDDKGEIVWQKWEKSTRNLWIVYAYADGHTDEEAFPTPDLTRAISHAQKEIVKCEYANAIIREAGKVVWDSQAN